MDRMSHDRYDVGIGGLGVMGRKMLLKLAEHGFGVAVHDADQERLEQACGQADAGHVAPAKSYAELVSLLIPPRRVLLRLPPGPAVDSAIHDLLLYLEPGDVIVDASNSHFRDTDQRGEALARLGIEFLGVGISATDGESARGVSVMPGGTRQGYEVMRPLLEAIAAQADGLPSASYLGSGSVGHYVKMVQNAIEQALMRLIAETYDFMRWGLALSVDELHNVYETWNDEELACYLLDVTTKVFAAMDASGQQPLIESLADEPGEIGPGRWAAQDAMELGVAAPSMAVAVAMRDLSRLKRERMMASEVLKGPERRYHGNLNRMLNQLRNALYASMILVFAQGMVQLGKATEAHGYQLELPEIVRVWQGGSTIRAALLRKIRGAYRTRPDLPNLLMDGQLGWEVMARQADLRAVVRTSAGLGIAMPATAIALGYFDAYRSAWSPANLIEAQWEHMGGERYGEAGQRSTFVWHPKDE